MNEHSFDDPQLAFLEAQLSAMTPQVSRADQQRFLYRCGIAAGREKSSVALRRWRTVASASAIAAAAVTAFYLSPRLSATSQPDALQVRRPLAVELDAWQLPQSEIIPPVDEIARLAHNYPKLRSRTVAALTRQALEQ